MHRREHPAGARRCARCASAKPPRGSRRGLDLVPRLQSASVRPHRPGSLLGPTGPHCARHGLAAERVTRFARRTTSGRRSRRTGRTHLGSTGHHQQRPAAAAAGAGFVTDRLSCRHSGSSAGRRRLTGDPCLGSSGDPSWRGSLRRYRVCRRSASRHTTLRRH